MERKVLPERPFEARGRGVHPPVFVSRGNKGLTGEIVVSRGNKGVRGESREKFEVKGPNREKGGEKFNAEAQRTLSCAEEERPFGIKGPNREKGGEKPNAEAQRTLSCAEEDRPFGIKGPNWEKSGEKSNAEAQRTLSCAEEERSFGSQGWPPAGAGASRMKVLAGTGDKSSRFRAFLLGGPNARHKREGVFEGCAGDTVARRPKCCRREVAWEIDR
jgi:hypothetical protein